MIDHPIIDSEFKKLIDPLSAQEFDALKKQIEEHGCLEPLSIWKTENGRILLDGHNRLQICLDGNHRYNTVNLSLDSRDHAKLWIMEHQVARRNLTDDQRAVIWNEIREQRSKVASAEGAAKARAAKEQPPPPDSVKPAKTAKRDTRAEVAAESHISESKLRNAQLLKKHHPKLYDKVRNGTLKLRDTTSLLAKPKKKPADIIKNDFFRHLGHLLDGVFKGIIKDRLENLLSLTEITPKTAASLKEISVVLKKLSADAEDYAIKINKISKARVA